MSKPTSSPSQPSSAKKRPPKTLQDIADLVTERRVRKIVLMTGAGTSTAAGIPDFRSPDTGLFANLQKYDLPFPEAVFELNYFRQKPEAFYQLAKELYPSNFHPTRTHYFFALLEDKGLLHRCYSQNIDCLETHAGMSEDKLVQAHGSFATATCLRCKKRYSAEDIRPEIEKSAVVRCQEASCKGQKNALVKPDITFYGEALPERFHQLCERDMRQADLVIVLGTSLRVYPFAGLVDMTNGHKVLINLEPAGDMRDFDVKLLGHCDDIIDELADLLGWKQELNLLQQAGKDRFEASRTPKKPKATEAAVKTAEKVGEAASKRDSVDVDELSSAIDQVKLEEPKNADKLGERKESQEQEGRTEEDERTEAEEARSDAASSTEPKASL